MQEFKDVDWVAVRERLTVVAYRLFLADRVVAGGPALAGFGTGPEDLAHTVLCALLDPDDGSVRWPAAAGSATTETVTAFLVTVMKRDFLDLMRSKRRKLQVPIEIRDAEGEAVDSHERVDPAPDVADQVMVGESLATLLLRLEADFAERPDEELQLYVWHIFRDGEYHSYTPAECGKALGLPADRIYRLKAKLERRLHRLYASELRNQVPGNTETRHEQEAR